MGITYIEGKVANAGGVERSLRFLVDSGSQYTVVPAHVWHALKLQAKRSLQFSLADGTIIQRAISECHISLPQGDGHTPVVLGEGGDQALLGAITLEELGLVLNPFSRTLQPMQGLMI